jgi:dimethylaniline monooxygenase (N-oxide forming) / hypotaurine monooxygenase
MLNSISTKAMPVEESWKFFPPPSAAMTAPLIADEIYPLLKSGFAEPVRKVKTIIGPRSVEMLDGRIIDNIDAIIYCTGYDLCVPFLSPEFNPYPVVGEPAQLFHGTFPLHPDPEVRNSLAFLGHGGIAFPGFVQHEVLGMVVSQTWLGRSLLPPYEEMLRWHRDFIKWRTDLIAKQPTQSTFLVAMQPYSDHLHWMDKQAGIGILEHFGWTSWKAWQFWWQDREFYAKCVKGLWTPAIWRLFETGKRKAWPQAREQIYIDNEIADQATELKKNRKMTSPKISVTDTDANGKAKKL